MRNLFVLTLSAAFVMSGPAFSAENTAKPAAKTEKHAKAGAKAAKQARENRRFTKNDRMVAEGYMAGHHLPDCPPGVARETEACVAVGQKHYQIGKPLAVTGFAVDEPLFAQLEPLPESYTYIVVDNDVLLVAEHSRNVLDAITLKKIQLADISPAAGK